jgi:predicted restriction endonuclease
LKSSELSHTSFPLQKSPPLKLRNIQILEETRRIIADLKSSALQITESKVGSDAYTGFTFDFGEGANTQLQEYFKNKRRFLERKQQFYQKNGVDLLNTPTVVPIINNDTVEISLNDEIKVELKEEEKVPKRKRKDLSSTILITNLPKDEQDEFNELKDLMN